LPSSFLCLSYQSSSFRNLAGTFPVDLLPESCLPKKAIKKKAAPKKPMRGRKTTKQAGKVSTDYNAAEKTTGHLKKDDYLVIIERLTIKKNYDA
jgi:hypothetical protein